MLGEPWAGPTALQSDPAAVTAVNLSIFNNGTGTYLVTNSPLTGPPWSGTFNNLPRHASLTYEAEGLIGGVVDFDGQTTASFGTPTGAVTVVLRPVAGPALTMPKVTAMTDPSPVMRGTSANYTFQIQGEPNEVLTWTVAAVDGGANQWPTKTGTITLNGSGTLAVPHSITFGAPNAGGPTAIHCNRHTLSLLDAEGLTFRAWFTSLSCNTATNPTCSPVPPLCQ